MAAIALCVWSFSAAAADYTDDDAMLHKLFEMHLKLAKQGNLESMTRLGLMYERGEGVEQNRKKAIELYQTAAEQGFKPAKELLANVTTNKSNAKQLNSLDTIHVPKLKKEIADNDTAIEKQKELENKLEQEQADAAAAREELERLRATKQQEEEKQRQLQEQIEKVKKAQEQLAQERAKAEATRRQMEDLRKQQEEELKRQELQRQELQRQLELADKQPQSPPQNETGPANAQVKGEKAVDSDTAFSSNPCNTPAAKFMSTCN